MNNLYENVKYLCEKKNMNMKELEQALSLSQGYISRRKKDIYASKLHALSLYFGVDMGSLFLNDLRKENRLTDIEEEIERLKEERDKLKGVK